MTKIYTIPQYDLPKPKPSPSAVYRAEKLKDKKLRIEERKFKNLERKILNNTKGKLWYIYLLELEHGMHYLGTTTNVKRRFEQHQRGKNGAKWTKLHKPIRIIMQQPLGRMSPSDACKIEQMMFYDYFPKYGYTLRGAGNSRVEPNW